MGFFDAIGKAIGSSVNAVQETYIEKVLENTRRYENDTVSELVSLVPCVESKGSKLAIILAIGAKGAISEAIQTAKDNNIGKRAFENFLNSGIGHVAKEMIRDWDR